MSRPQNRGESGGSNAYPFWGRARSLNPSPSVIVKYGHSIHGLFCFTTFFTVQERLLEPSAPLFCASRPSWESWRLHRSRISTQSRLAICSSCQYNVIVSKRHIASMNGCILNHYATAIPYLCNKERLSPDLKGAAHPLKTASFPHQALNKSVFPCPQIFSSQKGGA